MAKASKTKLLQKELNFLKLNILSKHKDRSEKEQKYDFVRCVLIKFLKDITNDKINAIVL